MKKHLAHYIGFLSLIGLVINCKDSRPEFSPGAGDRRIVGTWQLVERRFIKDSSYSITVDTIKTTRDTSFYSLKRYSPAQPQTLSFGADGNLVAAGTEMTYYNSIRHFRVDSSFYGLSLSLYISTNGANVPFRQGVAFRQDTLVLLPQCYQDSCNQGYYLKLVRAR
ncbi:hypothetical protein ACFSUS_17110 [Spirosoma soli]|uniref:Lipocalin-like domain-containing protein n=1 Tax=Spirosoma soli TaxID=1770529 RepID=A0ABW5M9L1_9BACT